MGVRLTDFFRLTVIFVAPPMVVLAVLEDKANCTLPVVLDGTLIVKLAEDCPATNGRDSGNRLQLAPGGVHVILIETPLSILPDRVSVVVI